MVRLFAGLLATLLIAPQSASALQYDNIKLTPKVGLAEHYDSNIYLVPEDQPSGARVGGGVLGSWIHEISGGLDVEWTNEVHSLDLGYDAMWKAFQTQPGTNNYDEQRAKAKYGFKGSWLNVTLHNNFINTEDPAFSELVTREQRWHNNAGLYTEYKQAQDGGFFAGLDFQHDRHKYVNPSLATTLNRFEAMVGLRTGFYLQPKTKAYLAYYRQVINYNGDTAAAPNNRNNKSHLLNFVVEGDLTGKLKGDISTGLILRDYDERPGNVTGYSQNWQTGIGVTWQALERTAVRVSYNRAVTEAVFATNRFYIANMGNLSVSHKMMDEKLTGHIGLGLGVDKYPEAATSGGVTANRRDDYVSKNVGLDYKVNEWLAANLGYVYTRRTSRFSGQFSYAQHLTSLGVKAMF